MSVFCHDCSSDLILVYCNRRGVMNRTSLLTAMTYAWRTTFLSDWLGEERAAIVLQ